MFGNYLKTAARNILKHRGFTLINIVGLALGMACCILILLYVFDEAGFDRFHENADNIYRVIAEIPLSGNPISLAISPPVLAPDLKETFPDIVDAARFRTWRPLLTEHEEKKFVDHRLYLADPSFFEIFTFPFVYGDPATALTDPMSVVMSSETAEKYFGLENPIGQTITVDNRLLLTVTGVVDVPLNSHLTFELLAPMKLIESFGESLESFKFEFTTYVLLQENHSAADVGGKILEHMQTRFNIEDSRLFLQPLTDVYLHSHFTYDYSQRSDVRYIYIFSAVALFILIIASINFINLTTARAGSRAREVGIRKVVGAQRSLLVRQFLGESMLISFVAFLLSLVLAAALMPSFNVLSGKQFTISSFGSGSILPALLGIALLTGLVSGSYPALFLSAIQPVKALRGALSRGPKSAAFRNILVVFQFALSTIFITGTLIVYNQLDYIRDKDIGYERAQVVAIPIRGDLGGNFDAFRQELLKNPAVSGVTAASHLPTNMDAAGSISDWEGRRDDSETFMMNFAMVDHDFAKVLGIDMAEGRFFTEEFPTDTTGFVLNETAVRRMELDSPLGTRITFFGKTGTVLGVAKDFHFVSLHAEIEPLMLYLSKSSLRHIFCRIRAGNIVETVGFIRQAHERFNPEFPFDYTFLDENFDRLYRADERFGRIFTAFSVFAIIISCLGILGLAAFITGQRTKELGIRKVLGATVPGIVCMLSKDFIMRVLIANLIAWPAAWYIMDRWLQEFAYRITIDPQPFIQAGLLTVVIAWLTVGYLAVRAARANPVDSLRYE